MTHLFKFVEARNYLYNLNHIYECIYRFVPIFVSSGDKRLDCVFRESD